jgi:hypothetical protein
VTVVEAERCPACDRDLGGDDHWSPADAERRGEPAREPADLSWLRRASRLAVGSAAGLVALAAAGSLPVVPVDAAVALGTDSPAAAALVAAVLVSAGLLVRTGFRPALYGTTLLFAALLGLAAAALAPAGVVVFLAGTVAGVVAVRERRATGSATPSRDATASVGDRGRGH